MRHTIDEAAKLVGRTRRSLYRAMDAGRVSYGVGPDGRRYLDTAELLRAYGPFETATQGVTVEMSQGVTAESALADAVAVAVAKAVGEAVEPLRREVAALRAQLAERPQITHDSSTRADTPPQSFADLLHTLN